MRAEDQPVWSGAEPLAEFLDGVPCSLLSTAGDGLILAVNDTFLHWSGYERSEIVGVRRFDDLLTLACRVFHETHYAPLLRIQGFVREVALDFVGRDGSTLPALVNTAAKPRSDGTIEFMRVAIFGASDRRKYEHQLLLERRSSEEAVKAKADFLAMFAHEIRNPLHAMLLQTELLESSNLSTEDADTAHQLRESLDRVLRLLNSMLDISKLEAGKATLQKTEFEIGDVVQAVVHTLRPLAEQRNLAVAIRVDPELPKRVIGDPVKLDQALTNLVGNAIKFTEHGSVTIAAKGTSAGSDSVDVRFWVKDTGIGIPLDRHAQIFEDYEQADASISQRFGGTGLGLAITRKLVKLQGGQLRVTSAEGKGATFSFDLRFPVATAR
jgi:signal transduction histidine kinase